MRKATVRLIGAAAAIMAAGMLQAQEQTLVVSGHPGSVPVVQLKGRNYVEIEALARAVEGTLAFRGDKVVLTIPESKEIPAAPAATPPPKAGLSQDFLRAGIEAMTAVREWHSALASAITNQYPITSDGLSPYERQASASLRQAQAAATTDADQKGVQFITGEFERMKQLHDKYLARRASLNYIDPNALENDPVNQTLLACGRALSAMVASGQYSDDPACH
jgi:hypothetical protein